MTDDKKEKFLESEIWLLTFSGGLGRSGVYRNNTSKTQKSNFRCKIRQAITSLVAQDYSKAVSYETHFDELLKQKKRIDQRFSRILSNGEINIGIVQKIINLYLKYKWCLGQIPSPPHCPLDRIIIGKLGIKPIVAWTKISDIDEYRRLMDIVKEKAGTQPIAKWELQAFYRRNQCTTFHD